MEYPLKIKILQFILSKLEATSTLEAEFTLNEIGKYTDEYKPSISRELRTLKKMKVITFVCINKRMGAYKILLDKSGAKSLVNTKKRIQLKMNKLMDSKKSAIWQTKRLLHDAARNISEMSAKSEIIQS